MCSSYPHIHTSGFQLNLYMWLFPEAGDELHIQNLNLSSPKFSISTHFMLSSFSQLHISELSGSEIVDPFLYLFNQYAITVFPFHNAPCIQVLTYFQLSH